MSNPFAFLATLYPNSFLIFVSNIQYKYMSWKDWLYIPKSDKVVILILLAIILLLLGINLCLSHRSQKIPTDFTEYIPEDYKAWQQQLHNKQKEEKGLCQKKILHVLHICHKEKMLLLKKPENTSIAFLM